jgi:putative ABC transport system permease protein
MRKIIKFAANNVTANKKRTIITLAVIIIGLCSINIGKGIMSGMQKESELSLTRSRTGEIQLHKKGYFDASELSLLDYSIDNASQLQDEIRRIQGVEDVTGRIQFGGLLAKGDETAVVVFCKAVNTKNEVKVCPRIKENITEGRFLTPNDTSGAVIADGLKKGIDAKIGDSIILVANTKDNFQNAVEVQIVGVIKEKAAQANTRLVYLSMEKAQELLYMGDEVTEIVISIHESMDVDSLTHFLNKKYEKKGLESNTWMDVSPFFVGVMQKQNMVVFSLCLIFYSIVISSIANTMILTLFERKKEIGTMMAIGIGSKHIIQLIMLESVIIGFVGSLLGVILSSGVILLFNQTGLNYRPPASPDLVTIYPLIDFSFMFLSFLLGIVSSVIGSLYPARKVLQVNPIDALRIA